MSKENKFVRDPDQDQMLDEAASMLNLLVDENIPGDEELSVIRNKYLPGVTNERMAEISAFLKSGEAHKYILQRNLNGLSAVFGIYDFSREILKKHSDCFVQVTPHDNVAEMADKLWLEYTPDDDLCSGEYLSVELLDEKTDLWSVSMNDANKVGGVCQTWSTSGNRDEVLWQLGRDFDW